MAEPTTGGDLFSEREMVAASILMTGHEGNRRVLLHAVLDGKPVAAMGIAETMGDGVNIRPLAIMISDEMFHGLEVPGENAFFIDMEE